MLPCRPLNANHEIQRLESWLNFLMKTLASSQFCLTMQHRPAIFPRHLLTCNMAVMANEARGVRFGIKSGDAWVSSNATRLSRCQAHAISCCRALMEQIRMQLDNIWSTERMLPSLRPKRAGIGLCLGGFTIPMP